MRGSGGRGGPRPPSPPAYVDKEAEEEEEEGETFKALKVVGGFVGRSVVGQRRRRLRSCLPLPSQSQSCLCPREAKTHPHIIYVSYYIICKELKERREKKGLYSVCPHRFRAGHLASLCPPSLTQEEAKTKYTGKLNAVRQPSSCDHINTFPLLLRSSYATTEERERDRRNRKVIVPLTLTEREGRRTIAFDFVRI